MLWCQDGRFIGPESKEIDLKGYFKPVKFKPIKFTPTECVFLKWLPYKNIILQQKHKHFVENLYFRTYFARFVITTLSKKISLILFQDWVSF